MGSALVGNALYFGIQMRRKALKYDLELRQVSLIQLPCPQRMTLRQSLLTTTEDGGLVLIDKDDSESELYMWSRKDTHEVDAKWERRVIGLKEVFPVDVDVTKLNVNGSGVGIIFMRTARQVYTIDLKTYKVKKVYGGTAFNFVPYMNFYTPGTILLFCFGFTLSRMRNSLATNMAIGSSIFMEVQYHYLILPNWVGAA